MAKHKYISQDAAIDAVDVCNLHRGIIDALQAIISDIPSADVVQVVRCKDCINWNGNDCITMHGLSAPRPDDYCSRGEKNSG